MNINYGRFTKVSKGKGDHIHEDKLHKVTIMFFKVKVSIYMSIHCRRSI